VKRLLRLGFFVSGGWLSLLALSGCGHPASVKECEEIVEAIVRLEMRQADAGSDAVAEEVRATKESMRGDMMKRCVGRRLTDTAMRCVRKATTAQQIEEQCFD
jgi:hypothetical protein